MPALPRRADRRGDHFIVCGDGLLAPGDRLIVLATRKGLGRFLAGH